MPLMVHFRHQTVLPDRSLWVIQKIGGKCPKSKLQNIKYDIFSHFPTIGSTLYWGHRSFLVLRISRLRAMASGLLRNLQDEKWDQRAGELS